MLEFFVENRCCNIAVGLVDKRPSAVIVNRCLGNHRSICSSVSVDPVLLGSRRSMERLIFLLRHPQPVEQYGQLPGHGNPSSFASVLATPFGQL